MRAVSGRALERETAGKRRVVMRGMPARRANGLSPNVCSAYNQQTHSRFGSEGVG